MSSWRICVGDFVPTFAVFGCLNEHEIGIQLININMQDSDYICTIPRIFLFFFWIRKRKNKLKRPKAPQVQGIKVNYSRHWLR